MEQAEYDIMAAVERDHWWYRGMRRIARAWLDPLFAGRPGGQAAPGWRALDAGCGTGGNAAYLLGRYGPAHAMDLAPEAVGLAARHAPAGLLRGSVLELPYRDGAFDLVTSFEVLYHRAVPDEVAALREARRVLRPGGRLLLRMPAYAWLYSDHDRAVHTRRRYVAADVRALLEAAGFQVERLSYVNGLLFPLALIARLLERLRPPAAGQESAMAAPAAPVNAFFGLIMALEAAWLGRGRLPAGLSILALARSPEE